jgi:hypothetical protein
MFIVLAGDDYCPSHVQGLYTTLEKAVAEATNMALREKPDYCEVFEYQPDAPIESSSDKEPVWRW